MNQEHDSKALSSASQDKGSGHKRPGAAPASDSIDFKKLAQNYLRHWWVIAGSLLLCLGLTFIYLKKKAPIYVVHSTIMLNQDLDEGQSMSGISALAMSFGIGGATGSQAVMEDEMTRITSQTLLSQVVRENHLNSMAWTTQGLLKKKVFYYENEPFRIEVPQQILDTISAGTAFEINVKSDGKFNLKVKQDNKKVLETEVSRFPYNARTPLATFRIDTTGFLKKGTDFDFYAIVNSTPVVVQNMREDLNVVEVDKKGNGIYVQMDGPCIPRLIATVNSINELYNQQRYDQTLQRRKESLEFIENRLLNLYSELEESEDKIENFKRENNIVDPTAEAEYIFARKGRIEGTETETRTQLEIYEMIRDMLQSPKAANSLIPFTSTGNEQEGLPAAIAAYNELILQKMELESSVKGQSTTLDRINQQVSALRSNILSTLSREIQATKIALSTVGNEQKTSDTRIREIPFIEKKLTQLYRDREVKNTIYAFLLQKREEAEIAVAQVKPYGEIVDTAYSDVEPAKPNRPVCWAVGLALGLILGAGLMQIFFRNKDEKAPGEETAA